MDPYKGGILQSIITFFLNIFLYVVYGILKIVYIFKKEEDEKLPYLALPSIIATILLVSYSRLFNRNRFR